MARKFLVASFVFSFFVFVASGVSFVSAQTSSPSTIEALQKQIQDLLAVVQSLSKQVSELKSELGVVSTPTTITQTTPTTTAVSVTPIIQTSATTTSTTDDNSQPTAVALPDFTRTLGVGSSGDDVRKLQEFLAQDKIIYPEGLITGYFGPATERAMKRLQEKHGLEQVGRVGPKTMMKLNELTTKGAGKSGVIPPGLLTAPGLQKKIPPIPEQATSNLIYFTTTTATTTWPYVYATSTYATTTYATSTNYYATTTYVYVPPTTVVTTPSTNSLQTVSTSYGSVLNLSNVSNLFQKIWGPGSNGITLGGGLNFSTKVGVGWSQQYGGLFVTSYSIQASSAQYYLTQGNSINVSVTGPAGSIIEVWDLESMTAIAKNGTPVIFTAQPNHRYGGFAWYADNSQKDIAISATQSSSTTTTTFTTFTTATSTITTSSSTATTTIVTNPPIFTVISPNGGEQFSVGNTYTITWASAGAKVSYININLYKSGSFITNLGYNVSNNGSLNWTIPPTIISGNDYKIRVYSNDYMDFNNYDESNNYFSITVPLTAPSAPIGYWKFDGSGNNEITGSPSAVAVGSSVFKTSAGKFNGYLYIPGSSDYAKIPYNSMFDLPNSFSVEFWFRQHANQSFNQNLVYKGNSPNNYNFNIFRNLWNQYNNGAVIAGSTVAGTGYWHQASNNNEPPHNNWHHVVYTKTPTSIAYYIDGALINSDSFTATSEYGGPVKTPAVDIIIGNPAPDTDIDNLRIYNYSLSIGEVLYNYAENVLASAVVSTATSTVTTTSTTPVVTLVAPTNIRADWSYGWWDIRDNTMGHRIIFQYPTDSGKKTTKFRLYAKNPGSSSFSVAAEFFGIDSTSCSKTDKSVIGQWIIDNNGSCGYWNIHYVKTGTTDAYVQGVSSLPLLTYSVGEYNFYITAVDSAGNEGSPSPTAKLAYLNPLTIVYPTANQALPILTPTFQWTVNSDTPSALPHFAIVFDKANSTNPIWSPYFSGGTSKTYDGPALDPTKQYKFSVFGIDVDTAQNKSTLVMPSSVNDFTVTSVSLDVTPPVISPLRVDVYANSALPVWITDEPATTQVEYGLTTSYGNITPLDSSGAFLRTVHSVILSSEYGFGLTSNTTYHYRMISKDARYNTATSGDYTFTTLATSTSSFAPNSFEQQLANISVMVSRLSEQVRRLLGE